MRGKEKLRRFFAKGRAWRYQMRGAGFFGRRRRQSGSDFLKRERQRGALALLLAAAVLLNIKCYPYLFVPELDDSFEAVREAMAVVTAKEGEEAKKEEEARQEAEEARQEAKAPSKNMEAAADGEFDEDGTLTVEHQGGFGGILSVGRLTGELPKFVQPKNNTEKEQGSQPSPSEKINVAAVLEERFGNLKKVRFQDFISNYYIVDPSTKAVEADFPITTLASKKVTVKRSDQPQILIYHTHGSEGYIDSRPGMAEDTVIGAGDVLAQYLETYGFHVIHVTEVFDRKADGSDDRNNAYNNTLPVIRKILAENPGIEVVIDLHRDSGEARRATVNGQTMAKIMLFNGLCRTKDGPISYYSNENLTGNLAFSLQTQVTGNELFPGLMHRIYLKSYRYNMNLMEKYLLVELGTHKNTTAEAMAAMKPFAEILAAVLTE